MRAVLITYTVVVDLDDDQPDGELPKGATVKFGDLPSDVAAAVQSAGEEYMHSVRRVEPDAVEFLS